MYDVTPDFIAKARALAFYRKFKTRRARRAGASRCDNESPLGWEKLGAGGFGEAWAHEDHFGYVVKISGREWFGTDERIYNEPALDGWPTFAQHCQAHPHPNLPKIMHFERLSLGVSFGIMPWYETIDPFRDADIVDDWCYYLEGGRGAPEWLWPIIGMRGALGMRVDLHSGNVMRDPVTHEYIMTDPFSCTERTSWV